MSFTNHRSDTRDITDWDVDMRCAKKNIHAADGRCWNTAARVILAFPKSVRHAFTLVNGTNDTGDDHWWVVVNDIICDIHYDIIDADYDSSKYVANVRYAGDSVAFDITDSGYDHCSTRYDGRDSWTRVKTLDFDNMHTV